MKSKPKNTYQTKEYFDECIKNKIIPEDTPPGLKKELEKAIKNFN